MNHVIRIFAVGYTAIVVLSAFSAWSMEIFFQHEQTEHLLPAIIFAMVTAPLSLSGEKIYSLLPSVFLTPLVQLAFLTICGVVQAIILWLFAKLLRMRNAR